MGACLGFLIGFLSCGAPEVLEISTSVISELRLGAEEPEGVSMGFNLDGFVSDTRDDRSCKKVDFVGPGGGMGVDNQLARLLPLLDLFGEGALQSLLQEAIHEGRLLVFFEVGKREDGLFDVRILQGEDRPLRGADGGILEGQTLLLKQEAPLLGEIFGIERRGDVLVADAGRVRFPVLIFDHIYTLEIEDAQVRLQLGEEGRLVEGVLGGGILVEGLVDMVEVVSRKTGVDLRLLVGGTIEEAADLRRGEDGVCRGVSMAVGFEVKPAFLF